MKITILRSSFQTDDFVRNEYAELIQRLENECHAEISILGDESVETRLIASLQSLPDVFLIATGGVENLFKRIWSAIDVETMCSPHCPKTVTMIADGRNNSLAAALEILTYLGNNGMEGRIVHGTNEEIVSALVEMWRAASLQGRIGLFGQPSDWLIASSVDRDYLRQRYGIETIDIDLQRVINGIKTIPQTEAEKAQTMVNRAKAIKEPSNTDMVEAAKAYLTIKKIWKASWLVAKATCRPCSPCGLPNAYVARWLSWPIHRNSPTRPLCWHIAPSHYQCVTNLLHVRISSRALAWLFKVCCLSPTTLYLNGADRN